MNEEANHKTELAVKVFDRHAQTYEDKYMDQGLYQDTLDALCTLVSKPHAAVLDVACGPGNVAKYLLGKRPDLEILGIDLAPNMLELAQKNNPQAKFLNMNCKAIARLPGTYDAIVCAFVLPYLSKDEAAALIADAAKLLNPGGVLYLSTMEDDYARSEWQTSGSGDRLFMHYHEGSYLVAALEQNGLKLLKQKRQDFPSPDGKKVTDLILIAVKLST